MNAATTINPANLYNVTLHSTFSGTACTENQNFCDNRCNYNTILNTCNSTSLIFSCSCSSTNTLPIGINATAYPASFYYCKRVLDQCTEGANGEFHGIDVCKKKYVCGEQEWDGPVTSTQTTGRNETTQGKKHAVDYEDSSMFVSVSFTLIAAALVNIILV